MVEENRDYKSNDILKIVNGFHPILLKFYFLIALIIAFLEIAVLSYSNALFIDTANSIFNNELSKSAIFKPLIFLILTLFLINTLMNLPDIFESKFKYSLETNLLPYLVKITAKLDYEYIEDEKSLELIKLVSDEMTETFMDYLMTVNEIVKCAIAIISASFIILLKAFWILPVLIVISFPILLFSNKMGKKNYNARKKAKKYERYYSYFSDEVLLDREISAERKVFNFKNEIAKIYYDNFKKASSIELKVLFKTKISMKLISIFITLASFIIIILFIKPLLENEITSGEFIGIITALFSLNQILSSSLQDASKNISEAKEYMKDLNTLLNFDKNSSYLKEAEHNMFFDSLEFKDIYFSYRNSNENILNGISFKIEKNKSYAFVGRNGAGKTTITKLITGLFDNYRGEILINGQDIKDYDPSEIKGIFSVIFQDFNIFETSIYDNIAFKSAKKELSDEKIIRVLKELKIGHVLDKLEDGIHQKIGKINDKSIEFSKGVGQKIALSRIILSDSPVKILDEPTSALDPLTENWLYEQFKKIMKEKTSILISHRLASTKICDQIFVIDNGKVVETGSHKELMKKDGLYKKMYTSQEEFYYESI